MDNLDKQTLDRSQRIRVARAEYAPEIAAFTPLQAVFTTTDALTDELERREGEQNADTKAETKTKDEWREILARNADTLSKQSVPWAAANGDTKLRLKLRVTYADLRYGEADEDMDAAREFVALVRAIPAADQVTYRIDATLTTAVEEAVRQYEAAEKDQIKSKQNVQLATLSMPELGRQLRAQLGQAKLLIGGQKNRDDHWAELSKLFTAANKGRKLPGESKRAKAARVVKKLTAHGATEAPFQLDDQNYAPTYEIRVENIGTIDLHLWMGLEPTGAAQGPPLTCPAGMKRTFRRSELGPETAKRLMGQFAGAPGGEAKLTIRRVVGEG